MGRWTQYDEDDYRLPEGVKRIGYDSDTGRYYFRDREGLLYKGPEGSEFGELTQVSEIPIAIPEEGDDVNDLEAAPSRSDGYQALAVDEHGSRFHTRSAYRTIFPFFLIIAVVLLLVWRLAFSPTHAPPPCPTTTLPYLVKSGDTCWDIANRHNSSLEKFRIVNPKVNCDKLMPGERVCVPEEGLKNGRRKPRY
ncbi:carbohydrate-binding module family 50 protein [Leucogyrophana mollusca]|uniref:Carbohydrate-binding module family 50 protein n=1 Tax=Leucogyrophana mollusca TaxID=85980 RepID=A0ACB8B708_9AGAM|nr:carbohydrate-binding module family 50 protein [Leucogyrophana mollusca]